MDWASRPLTRQSTGRQKRGAFGSLRWRSGAGYLSVKCLIMRVIDSENWAWFLFEHEGHFYLDANCNMSAFGYTYMIQLNDDERAAYKSEGHEYLNQLAHDIHYSVPIAEDTQSKYKGRDVSKIFAELASEAISAWRQGRSFE